MEAIEPAQVEAALWKEIAKTQEQVRRSVNTANRWLGELKQYIHIGEVDSIIGTFTNVVLEHVEDDETRAIIAKELRSVFPPE